MQELELTMKRSAQAFIQRLKMRNDWYKLYDSSNDGIRPFSCAGYK